MTLIESLRAQRAAIKAELEASVNVDGETRSALSDDEFDGKLAEVRKLDERISALVDAEAREAADAAARVQFAAPEAATATAKAGEGVRSEPNPIYRPDRTDASFFADMFRAKVENDSEARDRLARSQESRALASNVATTGGVFAPPAWLVEQYVALARPHRVTADLTTRETLPRGIASVNLPKVSTGSGVDVQQTQNSALSNTDIATTSVSSGISLIAGRQIVARQLIDQSGIPFDRVILQDLAAEYATRLDKQVLYGTGSNGQLKGLAAGGTTITFTTSSPKVIDGTTAANSFYNAVIRAKNSVESNRYLPASAIVMRPDRWNWILQALDSQSRPLVTPSSPTFNALADAGAPQAESAVGNFAGLPVYLDPNIPVTMNSATNQDAVFVLRAEDVYLWESELEAASFDATYADNASILFRVLGYAALIPDRYAASTSVILGTGQVQASL